MITGAGVRIGYHDQLLRSLDAEQPVVDAIRPAAKEFNEPQRRGLLARFGLTGDAVFQRVEASAAASAAGRRWRNWRPTTPTSWCSTSRRTISTCGPATRWSGRWRNSKARCCS